MSDRSTPTSEELEAILTPRRTSKPLSILEKRRFTEQIRGILRSNVTARSLEDPGHMSFEDIDANLHLYSRLFIALGLLTQHRGYSHSPEWLADFCSIDELESALREARRRESGSSTTDDGGRCEQ